MISNYQAYKAGYLTGRWCTKIVKGYLANKFLKSTLSKSHKIDSKNAGVVTKNVFECLQYLD